MPDNGFGWDRRDRPAMSDEFVEAQARYYHHTIQCFGADRCMFESNFPVDRTSISYAVLWNGLKKIAAQYSEPEQTPCSVRQQPESTIYNHTTWIQRTKAPLPETKPSN